MTADTTDRTTTTAATGDNPNFIDNDLDRVPDKAFRDYGLDDRLVDALEAKGITHPFPIQELTLPVALQGQDIIGQARTGTGKTLGFGLPMIQRMTPGAKHTQALVVTPTRELCLQVHEELRICESMGYTTTTVYGGVGYEEQTEALQAGADVVVGTPGRLLDMLGRGILDLSKVGCVILDEADEMLDMGFLPDVERLLNAANSDGRHTMLFSATMPASVVKLARRYTDNPLFMGADSVAHETAPTVDQHFFQVFRMDKPRVLARILQQPGRGNAMVFTRTKAMADRLVRELEDLGVHAIAIHGDLRQAAREKNLAKFRDGSVSVLCATEVAARGIDVENVTHVVNYDLPDDEKMYLHRIGRTARAGAKGVAVTFAEHNELARLHMIKKAVQQEEDTPEVFSTSDLLDELFDLPDETPWGHLSRSSGGGRSDRGSRGHAPSRGSRNKPRGEKHDSDDGSDHDRNRTRSRDRSGGRDDRDAGNARSRERRRDGATSSRDGATSSRDGGGNDRGGNDRGGNTRSDRNRSRGGSDDQAGSRTRTRERQAGDDQRRRQSSPSRSSSSSSGSSRSSSGRVRARGGKPVGGQSRSDDGDKDRGGSDRGRNRSGSNRGGNRSSNSSNANRSSNGSNGNRGGKGGNQRGGGRGTRSAGQSNRGGQSRGGGNGRSGNGNEGRVDLPRRVTPTRSGTAARGDGSPRLERRVEIEHLP